MGLNQHVGHVFVQDDVFFFKFGNQVPRAFMDVKIINQYVVQQFSQLGETNLVHVANVVQQIVKQLLHRGRVFPQLQRFYVGDIREIGFRSTRGFVVPAVIFLYMTALGLATGTISQLFSMLLGMNPTCSVINMYFNRMLFCWGMCM